jgi:hypothetical protein
MFPASSLNRIGRVPVLVLVLAASVLSGCKSQQDQALDQAKKQAAATGQPQQVVSVDKSGTTTTTVVQPPAPGQKAQAVTTTTTPPAAGTPAPVPAEPKVSAIPPPPPPVIPANVRIPAGTNLSIRIDQRISVKTSRVGDRFTGELVEPVLAGDNSLLLPKLTQVGGVVDASHRRGHFKGRSILELRLTSLTLNGTRYPLSTADLVSSKKGKGRRSTAMIGGGAGLGLLVGGLVGGGGGTALAGMTGNRDLDIPAESIVHFRLASSLVVQAP